MKPPEDFSLATAAATSAALPPLFGPLRLKEVARQLKGGKATSSERQQALADFRLSDGGVYDNLGVEPIWKSHAVALVSDGSGLFQGEADRGLFWRVRRYQGVQEEQARRLLRRGAHRVEEGDEGGGVLECGWGEGSLRSPPTDWLPRDDVELSVWQRPRAAPGRPGKQRLGANGKARTRPGHRLSPQGRNCGPIRGPAGDRM